MKITHTILQLKVNIVAFNNLKHFIKNSKLNHIKKLIVIPLLSSLQPPQVQTEKSKLFKNVNHIASIPFVFHNAHIPEFLKGM